MAKLLVILCLALIPIHGFSQAVDKKIKEENLNVAIGIDEIKKLDFNFNPKIKIGNEQLIQLILSPSKREITFRGIKSGKTSVIVREAGGENDIKVKYIVDITSDGNSNTVRELRELIGDVEGIEIKIKGGKVVVEGEIVVPNKIGKITSVLARYPDVVVLIEYSPQTQLLVAREMQEAINRNNMKDVTVRVVNGDYWIEGVVNSVGKKDLAVKIANAYLPAKLLGLSSQNSGGRFQEIQRGNTANFISVNEKKEPEPPPKLVKIAAQFVELSKDYKKVFAFKWAPFMTTDSSISFGKTTNGNITTNESGTLSGTISRLFPKLNSAKDAGYARVIQSGMVVVSEGKQAKIDKSTDVTFSVGSGDFAQKTNAKVSFSMNVTPKVGAQENIQLQGLSINVSLPNGNDSQGNPVVTTNSISTELFIKAKESAVIGGVVQNNSQTAYDKNDPDPATAAAGGGGNSNAQTSPLFNLLRSKSYSTSKSQFVVFITPEILESASAGTETIRKKFKKRVR